MFGRRRARLYALIQRTKNGDPDSVLVAECANPGVARSRAELVERQDVPTIRHGEQLVGFRIERGSWNRITYADIIDAQWMPAVDEPTVTGWVVVGHPIEWES